MNKIVLSAVILLMGCSDGLSNYRETQCNVSYAQYTFPLDSRVTLEVDKLRFDRFGRMSVHPKRNFNIKFLGSGWLKEGEYKNINCG